jgi:CHAD domain-containing protein
LAPVARAREIELTADMPYAEAAARTVLVRAEELVEHSGGVLDTGDIEHLHDMRVATRRLRATLEVFEPCFPRKPFKRALRSVKGLADALGERRDRDVSIREMRAFGAEMPSADQRGIDALVARLGDEQAEANDALRSMVSAEQVEALRQDLVELAGTARSQAEEPA